MGCDNIPSFEVLLSDEKTNKIIEALIRDHAFSTEFLASCVAQYIITILNIEVYTIKRGK